MATRTLLSPSLLCSFARRWVGYTSNVRLSSAAAATPRRRQTPRRALMYVPGNDERKQAKIPSLGADCICLDCEDGVAVGKKEAARERIRHILDEGGVEFGRSECSVRINPLDSDFGERDVETLLGGRTLPSAIHAPKVNSEDDVRALFAKCKDVLARRSESEPPSPVGLIMFVESARALLSLPAICAAAVDLSRASGAPLRPEALVFGSDDYVADVGATRTPEATELLYARQKVVCAAKAFALQAIDLVHIDFRDLSDLRRQSEEGARMGFTGKQVIHPAQVPVVQEAFSPSADKVEWATQLISEFRDHERSGRGAFTFRGSMIDMPLVKQAQNIVDLVESQ